MSFARRNLFMTDILFPWDCSKMILVKSKN
jgi:hypothetical protein